MTSGFMIMDEQVRIKGIEMHRDLTFNIASPRFLSYHIIKGGIYHETGTTVYYAFYEPRDDIYLDIYRCRFTRRNKQKLIYMKTEMTMDEVKEKSRDVYILVSGEKLPTDISRNEKNCIKRWMVHGLNALDVYNEKKFGDSIIISNDTSAYSVSTGNHVIGKNDSCFLDVNLLFIAMLIDYYEIHSGIQDKNAQIAFIHDSNYRRAIFERMKEVFCSFIKTNGGSISSQEITIELIIRKSLEILERY